MLQKRAFSIGNLKTSLRLEPRAWQKIDASAAKKGQKWQDWVKSILLEKPDDVSRSSHIRVSLM